MKLAGDNPDQQDQADDHHRRQAVLHSLRNNENDVLNSSGMTINPIIPIEV
ncbi:MAG: hypothetical protein SGJ20_04135 [Planctomycetota bacterium]|nr:hypothetical protein [Planctomycetota bacterium]